MASGDDCFLLRSFIVRNTHEMIVVIDRHEKFPEELFDFFKHIFIYRLFHIVRNIASYSSNKQSCRHIHSDRPERCHATSWQTRWHKLERLAQSWFYSK